MNLGIANSRRTGSVASRVISGTTVPYKTTTGQASSNLIILTGQRDNVTPNLLRGHTRMEWVNDPAWGLDEVYFNNPINADEVSIHLLKLDNSRGTSALLFLFSNDYDIMDSERDIQMLKLPPGRVLELFGTYRDGELLFKGGINFSSDFIVTESSLLTESGEENIVTEDGESGIQS